MFSLIREGYLFDILALVLVGIMFGSLVADAVGFMADAYLSRTVTGVLGGSGEYDMILHVREALKNQAEVEIRKILKREFPGARLKAGVSVAGLANFFIGLPPQERNKDGLERLPRVLGDVPGSSGETFIIEPRLTVAGIQGGTFNLLVDRISKLPGVKFCFRDGSGIGVVATTPEEIRRLEGRIRELLGSYAIYEVRFPLGSKGIDPARKGPALAEALKRAGVASLVKDVTVASGVNELDDLTHTLSEMRRFLEFYSGKVTLTVDGDTPLRVGEVLALGASKRPGDRISPGDILVAIEEITGRGAAGIIISGNSLDLIKGKDYSWRGPAYLVKGEDTVSSFAGEATVTSERVHLLKTMDEFIVLLSDLKRLSSNAYQASLQAFDVLGMYDGAVAQLVEVQRLLERIDTSIASYGGYVNRQDMAKLEEALNSAYKTVSMLSAVSGNLSIFQDEADKVVGKLVGVKSLLEQELASGQDAPGVRQQLLSMQAGIDLISERTRKQARTLDSFVNAVNPLGRVFGGWGEKLKKITQGIRGFQDFLSSDRAAVTVREMRAVTNSALESLQALDIEGIRGTVSALSQELHDVNQIDTDSIAGQLKDVRKSLPDLQDGEVGRSIRLIDRYMGGQVIPQDRIQILVQRPFDEGRLRRVIRDTSSLRGTSTFQLPIAGVQRGVRGEVYTLVRRARQITSGIAAFAFALLTLIMDHSAVVSAIRSFSGRERKGRIRFDWGCIYGALAGAALLLGIFKLSGAGLPYIDLRHVALGGGLLGFFVAFKSEGYNPVNLDEVMAGESLGLTRAQVIRNIIIPESRPGLLTLINRFGMKFRGRREGTGRVEDN